MKRIKWIWILGAILCVGCGSQAGKEPAQTSTPSPTSTEQPYVEPTAPPGAATQAVEKRNVTIQGHSYKYIFIQNMMTVWRCWRQEQMKRHCIFLLR